MTLTLTLVIIIITCLVSVAAFSNRRINDELIFYPPAITYDKQWYRFFSSGLIHADPIHLIFNMYAFYGFGTFVEGELATIFGTTGKIIYLVLYITALFFSILPTYTKHRDDSYYRALGASGAVSAIVFAAILLNPIGGIGHALVPGISIPGFVYGILYLVASSYMDKRGGGNINHSAHIFGALYGIAFMIVACYIFSNYAVLALFIEQIKAYLQSF